MSLTFMSKRPSFLKDSVEATTTFTWLFGFNSSKRQIPHIKVPSFYHFKALQQIRMYQPLYLGCWTLWLESCLMWRSLNNLSHTGFVSYLQLGAMYTSSFSPPLPYCTFLNSYSK
jgi:hypothetical protein